MDRAFRASTRLIGAITFLLGITMIVVTLASGSALGFEVSAGYILSLLYLAIFGSVVTFAAYLTLIERIGAARAGYVGVAVPIVALLISAAFEGFRWHELTYVGIVVSLIGNVVMLHDRG